MISQRIKTLAPSPMRALDAKAKQLQADGKSVINLCLGEPDFSTPDHINAAAIKAINAGFSHYTATAGIPELLEAISQKLKKDNHLTYTPSQISVGVGAKQILYALFQVLCDPGDEVIIPTPTWSTYVEQVKLAEGVPILVSLSAPFKLTAEDVEKYITNKTKILLLNSPSNPTGAMIDKTELGKIAQLAIKKNILILSDEIYEKIIFGKTEHVSIASLGSEIFQRTITINGLSKAYAMTGWRVGYAAGPQEIISALNNFNGQVTSHTASISQKAGVAALSGTQQPVAKMVREFAKRRVVVLKNLKAAKGLEVIEPEGAFYFFISVKKLLGKKYVTSEAWCAALLEKAGVAVVPGEAFFAPGYFRMSFAASESELQTACDRITQFVNNKD